MAGPLIALAPVYQVGTPEQVERFVRPFLADSGAPLAAMAFSEPEGSANFDAEGSGQGIRTTAVPDRDEWVINGRKAWASHLCGWDGDGPDIMTIVCRTPSGISLIVAEREHLAGNIEVEEYYDLPGLKGCLTTRVRLIDVRVPRGNLLGEEGQGADLTRNAFLPSGASIGIFAAAAMRQAFAIAYRFALTEKRGGPVPIIEYQAVSDVLADAKGKIEAVRLLAWRALDAVMSMHPSGPELALHAKIFGSETGVEVINELIKIVGVTAYDEKFPIFRYLMDTLSYPIIEGSNVGVRRRQLQALFRTPGYDPLSASGMA
jgi:alkylation response protein AidB-like acyl-CoA dehydrogenase